MPGTAPPASRCPSCGSDPVEAGERWAQRQDLELLWLSLDPDRPGRLRHRRHCARCQPHGQIAEISCALCGDGPMLTGELADQTPDEHTPPEPVCRWLAEHGWRHDTRLGLLCPTHPHRPRPRHHSGR